MLETSLIPSAIINAMKDKGYEKLTPVQEEVGKKEYAGSDLLVSAQTGSGKTIAFGIAIIINILKVDEDLIEKHSVVSSEVAEAMAENVKRVFDSDYGIATTGNAGPSKGDSDEAVGTVVIAIATPKGVYSQKFNFGSQRLRVVQKAVTMAFTLFQKEIFKKC